MGTTMGQEPVGRRHLETTYMYMVCCNSTPIYETNNNLNFGREGGGE